MIQSFSSSKPNFISLFCFYRGDIETATPNSVIGPSAQTHVVPGVGVVLGLVVAATVAAVLYKKRVSSSSKKGIVEEEEDEISGVEDM